MRASHYFFQLSLVVIYSGNVPDASSATRQQIPEISSNPMREAYFGDLHLHTSYSFDAYLAGGDQVSPHDAYRFARGDRVRYLGEYVQRTTPPLDFLAITDHSELMGVVNSIARSESAIGAKLRQRDGNTINALWSLQWTEGESPPGANSKLVSQSAWRRQIEAANRYYEPGKFTTFIAYEWTAMAKGQANVHLHRNVIFRGDRAPPPFTAADSSKPEDLWTFLENSRKRGYEALAIPHNPNLSNGLAFDWVTSDGKPIDQRYAEMRSANEPLVEISQTKGQSETSPLISQNDEFANFELIQDTSDPSQSLAGSYVRPAIGRGLSIATHTHGANPFKIGFVGGSDFHNILSDYSETAYRGSVTFIDDLPQGTANARMMDEIQGKLLNDTARLKFSSGSLTGVWADMNTRESIYAALRRRETFATSGTRLKLRFFGGWNFNNEIFSNSDWLKIAYSLGVPMGGDLAPPQVGTKTPTFVLWAVRDPNATNLERLQVIKTWLRAGMPVERVFDVAIANTAMSKIGKFAPSQQVDNRHQLSRSNLRGATTLSAVWADPEFDPKTPAAYYLRAIEVPSPRWSTLLADKHGRLPPSEVPKYIQERGWSSPIWYTPSQ